MNAYKAIATRITNAEEKFINFAMETGNMSRPSAIHVLSVYRKVKAIKIDAVGGQFTFTHGMYADPLVLRNALSFDDSKDNSK